jgi:hypothetical protein
VLHVSHSALLHILSPTQRHATSSPCKASWHLLTDAPSYANTLLQPGPSQYTTPLPIPHLLLQSYAPVLTTPLLKASTLNPPPPDQSVISNISNSISCSCSSASRLAGPPPAMAPRHLLANLPQQAAVVSTWLTHNEVLKICIVVIPLTPILRAVRTVRGIRKA